ncbi:MAG: hypothetical protein Q8L39_13265 [Burkholderiales bacterium]|nr:hypothetical protein [Burkholderiales bacterium]
MYLLNGKKININAPMTLSVLVPVSMPDGNGGEEIIEQPDDVQFPAGHFADAAARAAAGITEVPDPVRPDERFNQITENDDGSLNVTPMNLAAIKAQYKDQIDQACGGKRAVAVSQGDYISEEYRRAYEDAIAYKDAGYTGTVPSSVKAWKDVSGMTNKAAADDIIATRDGYMALLDAIRTIRLNGKAAVDAAPTPDAILAAVATVNTSLSALP